MRTNLEKALVLAAAFLALGLVPLAAQEPEPAVPEASAAPAAAVTPEAEAAPETPAANDDGFRFNVDPVVLSGLSMDVDTVSSKFEEYRDVSSGFVPNFGVSGESADGNRTFDFDAVNIGRDDARYGVSYESAGRYQFFVDYNKIPHRFGNQGHILWSRTGAGRFELPNPLQQQVQNAIETQFVTNRTGVNFGFLSGLLQPYLASADMLDLGLQRDRTSIGFGLGSLAGLSWGLQVDHENRKGDRALGGSFGFSGVTELPEPIDYQTTTANLAGEWNGQRGGVRVGYRYSTFQNDVSTLIWDNPFRVTDSTDPSAYSSPGSGSIGGSSLGIFDLAPDNQANAFYMDGRVKLGGNWFASTNVSYNVMTQDDPLLPYTLNTAIVGLDQNGLPFDPTSTSSLPVRNADNEVQVMSLNGQLGTRFAKSFDLTFNVRYYDYDNQSPRIAFPGYARYHAVWEEIGRITVPYSYTRQDMGAELGWDVARATRLGFAFNRQSYDRDFREVDESDEDTFRLTFDTRPKSWVSLQASYEVGDRSTSEYHTEAQEASFLHPEGVNNQLGLRMFALAAREFDGWNVLANFYPVEAWSLALGVSGRNDDYNESELGLISDEILQYNAELAYTPGEKLNLFVFGHRADRDSLQRARQSGGTLSTNPLDNWSADFNEVTDTWGLGFNSRFARLWSFDTTASWSNSDGLADIFSPPGGTPDRAVGFDNYEDIELFSAFAELGYQVTPRAKAGLFYRYEDYTLDSFILQGLRNFLPGAVLLDPTLDDYQGNVFGLTMRFNVR